MEISESEKNESVTKYEDSILKRVSDKIYNSIVKIKINNVIKSTGFFMKMKSKIMKSLFVFNNVISDNDIKNKILINIIK